MNSLKRNYESALAALEELTRELAPTDDDFAQRDEADRTPPRLAAKPLSKVLNEFGTLPDGTLFLGAAYDGLPILLNLNDPTPGPILVAGDQGSGKTDLLKMIAQGIEKIHTPNEVQFGVVSSKPQEWRGIEDNDNCMGIFPSYKDEASDFIRSLSDWAHDNRHESRFALLLIDELESVLNMDDDVQQSLRWLLLRGPNRRVWTFVTLDVARRERLLPWLDAFRTRLFGSVKNLSSAKAIVPTHGADLHLLEAGKDFVLYENRQWVKFWVPSVD